jgi:hypothetical protein
LERGLITLRALLGGSMATYCRMACQISEPRNQSAPHKTVPNNIPKRTSPALMGGCSPRESTVSRSPSISLRRRILTPCLHQEQYLSIRPISDISSPAQPVGMRCQVFLTKTVTRRGAVIALPQAGQKGAGGVYLRPSMPFLNRHWGVPSPRSQTFIAIPLNEAPLSESPGRRCLLRG